MSLSLDKGWASQMQRVEMEVGYFVLGPNLRSH